MTFSSNLLSPHIKTHTRLQVQIGICRSRCVLLPYISPQQLSETRHCHRRACEPLRALQQAQLPLQMACSRMFHPMAQEASSCTPERTIQKSKQELGWLARLFAVRLGGFVNLSGGIYCKTPVNYGVRADIKSRRPRRTCHRACGSTLRWRGCSECCIRPLALNTKLQGKVLLSENKLEAPESTVDWMLPPLQKPSLSNSYPCFLSPAHRTPSILVTLPLKVTFSLPLLSPQPIICLSEIAINYFYETLGPICPFPEAGPNAPGRPNGSW